MPVIELIYKDGTNRKTIIPFDKIECVCLVPAYRDDVGNPSQGGFNLTIATGMMSHNQHWETEAEALEVYDSILKQMKEMK